MYSLDEKIMSEDRAIIAISRNKGKIETDLKPGMFAFEHEKKDAYVVAAKETLHRIIKEEEDGKVHGTIVFADDVLIENNLIVRGETTKVETVDLVISDNIIELNKDEAGAGVTRAKAGIMINRGTEDDYYTIFCETTERAGLKGYSHFLGETALSTIYSNGDFWTKGDLDTQNALVNQNLTVKKHLSVLGDTTLNGAFNVIGDSSFTGAVYMDSTLDVSGNTAIGGSLTVTGVSTFKANSTFKQDVTIENNLFVKKSATIDENATVGLLATLGSLSVVNESVFNGIITAKSTSTFEDVATFNKDVKMLANLSVGLTTTSKDIVANNTLSVKGNSTFTGSVLANGGATFNTSFDVNSHADLNSSLTVDGITTLNNALNVLLESSTFKDVTINENLSVVNNISTNNIDAITINTSSAANLESANITNDLTISGDVSCAQTGRFKDLIISGTTSISSSSTFFADAEFKENVTINKNLNVKELATIKNLDVTNILTLSSSKKASFTFNELNETNTTESLVVNIPDAALYKNCINNVVVSTLSKDSLRMNVPVQVSTSKGWGTLLDSATGHREMHMPGGTDVISPSDIGAIKNQKGVVQIGKGLDAEKGVPDIAGSVYVAADTRIIYANVDNKWEKMSASSWSDITNVPDTFTPPIATTEQLGGIKVGNNLVITEDGTLSVPNISIEYTVHRKEFITQSSNMDTFKTDIDFTPGCNLTSVYVFGKLLPPSAYTEVDERTIVLHEPVALNTHVEIIVLVVPSKATFTLKREEFYATAYQKRFVLTRGQYLVGENKLNVYLFGALLPPSAYKEINSTTIELNDNLTAGDQVMIEYFSGPEISSMKTTCGYSYSSRSSNNVFEFLEPKEVWTINHNTNTYPTITAIAYNGLKLEPIGTVYQDQNTVHLTFASPVAGRAFVK